MLALLFVTLCAIAGVCGLTGVMAMGSDRPIDQKLAPRVLGVGALSALGVALIIVCAR